MPSYKYETHMNAPAFTKGRPGKITDIVIHHYGDDGASYESSNAWLTRPEASTSAHYVVDAGRVACLVDPDDIAYHAGNWPVNQISIGIENNPIWTAAREATLIELCADIEEKYGSLRYSVHQNHSLTACPGRWVARVPHIIAGVNAELARRKAGGKTAPAPAKTPSTRGKVYVVKPGDTLSGIAARYGTTVAALRARNTYITNPHYLAVGDRVTLP